MSYNIKKMIYLIESGFIEFLKSNDKTGCVIPSSFYTQPFSNKIAELLLKTVSGSPLISSFLTSEFVSDFALFPEFEFPSSFSAKPDFSVSLIPKVFDRFPDVSFQSEKPSDVEFAFYSLSFFRKKSHITDLVSDSSFFSFPYKLNHGIYDFSTQEIEGFFQSAVLFNPVLYIKAVLSSQGMTDESIYSFIKNNIFGSINSDYIKNTHLQSMCSFKYMLRNKYFYKLAADKSSSELHSDKGFVKNILDIKDIYSKDELSILCASRLVSSQEVLPEFIDYENN